MVYRGKKSAFSIVEILVGIAVISIFFTILFPILKSNNKLNKSIYTQGIVDRKKGDIIKIIEKVIERSNYYFENDPFKGSVEVLQYDELVWGWFYSDILKNSSKKGNLLLIKLPQKEEKKIKNYFMVFHLYHGCLTVHEGEYNRGYWKITNSCELIKYVSLTFEKVGRGIFIEMKFEKGDKGQIIKGYENFKK